jgi:hypothetical protein
VQVSWQGLQQLQQELAVLQQLQHAYILQLRGWGQQQEVAYMLHEPTSEFVCIRVWCSVLRAFYLCSTATLPAGVKAVRSLNAAPPPQLE